MVGAHERLEVLLVEGCDFIRLERAHAAGAESAGDEAVVEHEHAVAVRVNSLHHELQDVVEVGIVHESSVRRPGGIEPLRARLAAGEVTGELAAERADNVDPALLVDRAALRTIPHGLTREVRELSALGRGEDAVLTRKLHERGLALLGRGRLHGLVAATAVRQAHQCARRAGNQAGDV